MLRRMVCTAVGITIASSTLMTGCMLNTPERVVKRFVARLRGMRWQAMAELIDWPRSSRNVPGLPSSNKGEEAAKKEVMLRLAENLTGFPVRQKTQDQIQHEFIYLKMSDLKHLKEEDDWSWLEFKITTESRARKVAVLLMKIDRVWRIVLTESIFQ